MHYKQEARDLKIYTPLNENDLLVAGLSGEDALSTLFSYDLTLLSERYDIDADSVIGKDVTVSMALPGNEIRYIRGIITSFSQSDADRGGLSSYAATLEPKLWLLTTTGDCKIFQQQNIPDIVKKVLDDNKILYSDRLRRTDYPTWEYCVQYMESDFDFISRLMEEEGIYYYFEHDKDKHTMVLIDRWDSHMPCPHQQEARYALSMEGTSQDDVITDLQWEKKIGPAKYIVKDYNFTMPKTSLSAEETVMDKTGPGDRDVFHYSTGHDNTSEGHRCVRMRMDEEEAKMMTITGDSDCRAFTSGYRFKLIDYVRNDLDNKEYLLTAVTHDASQSWDGEASYSYSNSFACIPKETQFRPSRTTPKSIIQGSQTAIVTGPAGEEIYPDEYGRVKVQFHWDRYGKKDENTSCWIRVGRTWAGGQRGDYTVPRIGDEVMVDFLEGDPDRPIITGSVYHAHNMQPYKLPDHKTKTVIRTMSTPGGGGYNELSFEDKAGGEQVYIQAQKDMDVLVKHDRSEKVGNCKNEFVTINKTETIGLAKELTIGGLYQVSVGGAMNQTVGAAKAEEVALSKNTFVGKSYSISAGDAFEIKNGASAIQMKKDGNIEITGNDVTFKTSGGTIHIDAGGIITIKGAMVKINT